MSALAGARRSASSVDRFTAAVSPPELVLDIDPGPFEPRGAAYHQLRATIASVDGVVRTYDATAVAVTRVVDGRPDRTYPKQALVGGGGRYYDVDRVTVVEGAMPDRSSSAEALVNRTLAREEGISVGDRLDLVGVTRANLRPYFTSGDLTTFPTPVRVTGIGELSQSMLSDQLSDERTVVLPPGFAKRYDAAPVTLRLALDLAPGVSPASVVTAVRASVGERSAGIVFEDRARIDDRARRATQPYVLFLTGLGALAAAFTIVVGSQAVARATATIDDDLAALSQLGVEGRGRMAAAVIGPLGAGALGALGAVVVTVVSSPTYPVGPLRSLEPDTGFDVDLTVVGLGAFVLVTVAILAGAWSTRRRDPRMRARLPRARVVPSATRIPLPWRLGVGRALGTNRIDGRRAAWLVLFGTTGAVAAVAAVLTFDAGRTNLLAEPALHGWRWDALVYVDGGYSMVPSRLLPGVPGVARATGAFFPTVSVGAVDGVPAMSTAPGAPVTVLEGRAPAAASEIALGADTAHASGVAVGDVVTVTCSGRCTLPTDQEPPSRFAAGRPARLTVTGIVVLPGVGLVDTDRPTLATGALLAIPPHAYTGGKRAAVYFVEFDGAAPSRTVAAVRRAFTRVESEGDFGYVDVFPLIRPPDIASFSHLGAIATGLVVLLSVVAVASMGHGLIQTSRSGRREDAVLAALGLRPQDLRSVSRWQARTTLAVATAIGVPVGVVLGSTSWRALATATGVQPSSLLPLAGLALVVVTMLVGAELAVLVLARRRVGRSIVATLAADR